LCGAHCGCVSILLLPPPPSSSTLFPYTTLFRSETVVLLFDGDEAGRKAARAAYPVCAKAGLAARVVVMHGAKDPDELLREPGGRSEEHTSELQSLTNLVCRLLLGKKKHCAAASG